MVLAERRGTAMKAKDKLRVFWGKKQQQLMFYWPLGIGTKSDAHYLYGVFDELFVSEMQQRGYDIQTLRFAISPLAGNEKFVSMRKKGANRMARPIQKGDIVDIYYTDGRRARECKVLHVPQDTGDMWYFEDYNDAVFVQNPCSSSLDIIKLLRGGNNDE